MARLGTSASGGIVSIQDTQGAPLTSVGGALNVNVVGSSAATIAQYAAIDSVPIGQTSDILSYVVPVDKILYLSHINMSSTSVCALEIYINGALNGVVRMSYASSYTNTFTYNGFPVPAGVEVLIKGTNFSRDDLATFNVTMIGDLQ